MTTQQTATASKPQQAHPHGDHYHPTLSEGLRVREARREDGEAIAIIYNEAIAGGSSTMDTEPYRAADFAHYLVDPRHENLDTPVNNTMNGDAQLNDTCSVPYPPQALLVGELLRPAPDGRTPSLPHTVAWAISKRYSDRPGYRYAAETSVYVANAYQRCGYGAVMLEAIIAKAAVLGYRHLVAKILAVNDASVRFHQRFGFELVGRQRAIGFLNGQWHDVVIMQLLLSSAHPDGQPISASEDAT